MAANWSSLFILIKITPRFESVALKSALGLNSPTLGLLRWLESFKTHRAAQIGRKSCQDGIGEFDRGEFSGYFKLN